MEMDALVGFAEAWDFDSSRVRVYLRDKLRAVQAAEFETIVLGCTHFIFYTGMIREIVGEGIAILDGNSGTVARLKSVLTETGAPPGNAGGRVSFYSSGVRDDPRRESKLRELILRLKPIA